MNTKLSKISLILFGIAIVMSVVSCQTEEEIRRRTLAEKRAAFLEDSLSLKIGVLPTEDCYPALVAEKLSLFDSVGVVVHLRHYNALSECRYALKNKLVEGAFIDSTLAKIIEKEDKRELVFGPATSLTWKLVASKKSRVLRTAQLTEKIVAADSHGASHVIATSVVDSILRRKQNAFVLQCEDINVRYDMMHLNNVDAALLPEPYASRAVKEGDNIIKDFSRKHYGVLVMRSASYKDKRINEQYRLFIKAMEMANDSIKKNGVEKYKVN